MPTARSHSRFGNARDPRGQPLRHMEQLLLVTSCDSHAGIGASLRTHGHKEGRTDVKVEIVFQILTPNVNLQFQKSLIPTLNLRIKLYKNVLF